MTCSEYKDSGIEWIGEIPNRWDLIQIKNLFTERTEKNSGGNTNYLSIVKDVGVVLYADKGNVGNKTSDNPENYKMVYVDDLVINPMNLIIGSVGVSRYNGCLSSVYIVLSPNSCSVSSYYGYIFSHKIFQAHLKKICYGIMELRESLNKIEFDVEKLPYPPLQEQQQIANFLDYKTQQLDSLIEKTQQKIELLKEQRTALINQVVTKGLDPDAEMKDSGVEWIGEIPVGWDFVRLKFLFSLEGGKGPNQIEQENGKYPIYGTGGEVSRGIDFLFDKPSLLLGRKGTIDKPFVVYEPFWVSDVMYYTIQKTSMTPVYLWYMFKLVPFGFYEYGSTQPSMSRLDYESMSFPVPPVEEQEQILEYLDQKMRQIDSQVEKETRRIELLKEYRNALISEVVTGKIDVREEMVA